MANVEMNDRSAAYQEVPQNEGDKPPAYTKLFPDLNELRNLKDSDKSAVQKARVLSTILCTSCNFF